MWDDPHHYGILYRDVVSVVRRYTDVAIIIFNCNSRKQCYR